MNDFKPSMQIAVVAVILALVGCLICNGVVFTRALEKGLTLIALAAVVALAAIVWALGESSRF
jgi:hypothetical protein